MPARPGATLPGAVRFRVRRSPREFGIALCDVVEIYWRTVHVAVGRVLVARPALHLGLPRVRPARCRCCRAGGGQLVLVKAIAASASARLLQLSWRSACCGVAAAASTAILHATLHAIRRWARPAASCWLVPPMTVLRVAVAQ